MRTSVTCPFGILPASYNTLSVSVAPECSNHCSTTRQQTETKRMFSSISLHLSNQFHLFQHHTCATAYMQLLYINE